ncbi:MAG: hypothetical protein A3C93_05895 [Candidatus Lloydbacteria bacterium RIFCSPHIGHO2_02_FULL_54_17]|uniref:Uncharacterized protein n=1 Tax=Candidatus Lloydbacteria bacterium RIFCSPHIGHO2_02_FULL_54_17 TaxID=1798664 RepID=A0A1G2DE76_9BACT|nr:MAG: hypothetical protein A2762_02375 [Candidatus Lloydbacteria bacterium RIFCSPHIGHO2_01_FULL_54_11]OGZ11944.1 MAG: hypothetical protein A3C93_05895 [Candidatus Lloydbacteria bacterium RIFCSPHIGHO2_02_FULL_54_17]OGZ14198.1 MAG: hypothetical protein A2948_02585 [Candidatus Lloydbacteria bacterium RIFCSPLOWO2_01_FULL_54_18]OGZ15088.1 MAG: hypothetical protein A3H76_06715 [Candidatus Lloydbacteria bacterium RIFCSPLOWO2_02_FULL_54_12]
MELNSKIGNVLKVIILTINIFLIFIIGISLYIAATTPVMHMRTCAAMSGPEGIGCGSAMEESINFEAIMLLALFAFALVATYFFVLLNRKWGFYINLVTVVLLGYLLFSDTLFFIWRGLDLPFVLWIKYGI